MQKYPITVTRRYDAKSDWHKLAQCLADGQNYLSVGDSITDKLKDGREFTVEVAALNPYTPGTAAFVFRDYVGSHRMNDNNTNSGGWKDSSMRAWLTGEFFELLPDELQSVIKPRTIRQKQNDEILTSVDKLWLPSYTEVFGNGMESDVGDVQFEWFKNRRNRIKMDADGNPANWWERSPYYYSSYYFCSVHTSGGANFDYAHYSYGVAPAFII